MKIIYVTDKNYAAICATSIVSLFENNKKVENICLYLLADSIDGYGDAFKRIAAEYERQINIIETKDLIEEYKKQGLPPVNGSLSAYVRLVSYEILPELDKYVYIDCDTLVLDEIESLYNIDVDGYALGMVADSLSSRSNLALGRRLDELYFNSGVLIVNAKYWRENNTIKKILSAIEEIDLKRTATASDQELINLGLIQEIKKIPLKYNVLVQTRVFSPKNLLYMIEKTSDTFYSIEEIKEAKEKPSIVHFAGNMLIRPWFSNSYDPMRELWNDYLRKTGIDYDQSVYEASFWRKASIYAAIKLPSIIYAPMKKREEQLKLFLLRKRGRKI